jgi:sec-independent protein translocase protein TatA
MDTIGPWELLIILLVLVAIFGASRLPKMARSLGEGIREFRTALRDASTPAEGDSDIGERGPATDAATTERPGGDPRRSVP